MTYRQQLKEVLDTAKWSLIYWPDEDNFTIVETKKVLVASGGISAGGPDTPCTVKAGTKVYGGMMKGS
uniref:Uncharacterized protein n=1 Tax=Amphimedon queenslandica TaxID=400682 RepID=A0A1X7SG46_AMPQE